MSRFQKTSCINIDDLDKNEKNLIEILLEEKVVNLIIPYYGMPCYCLSDIIKLV